MLSFQIVKFSGDMRIIFEILATEKLQLLAWLFKVAQGHWRSRGLIAYVQLMVTVAVSCTVFEM